VSSRAETSHLGGYAAHSHFIVVMKEPQRNHQGMFDKVDTPPHTQTATSAEISGSPSFSLPAGWAFPVVIMLVVESAK